MSFSANIAFRIAMATLGKRAYRRLMQLAETPEQAQADTWLRIVQRCAATERGEQLGLSGIRNVDAFRARVPVSDYEAMRPGVERQIATGAAAIVAEAPVMYARTSGTRANQNTFPCRRAY